MFSKKCLVAVVLGMVGGMLGGCTSSKDLAAARQSAYATGCLETATAIGNQLGFSFNTEKLTAICNDKAAAWALKK